MMRRSEAKLRNEQLVGTIAMVVTPLKERLNQLCLCHWQSHQVVRKGVGRLIYK
jgi:phage terminase large subunit-like protein